MSSTSKNNKFLWIAIGAGVLALAIYFSGVMPSSEDVAGAVKPAKKHEAKTKQISRVNLYKTWLQEWMQTPEFPRFMRDPEIKKIIREAFKDITKREYKEVKVVFVDKNEEFQDNNENN